MAKTDRMVQLDQDEHSLMVNGLNYFRKAMEEQGLALEEYVEMLGQ